MAESWPFYEKMADKMWFYCYLAFMFLYYFFIKLIGVNQLDAWHFIFFLNLFNKVNSTWAF